MKAVRDLLKDIARDKQADRAVDQHSYKGFTDKEKLAFEDKGYAVYAGKVRELLVKDREILIYHSDRLSAFDRYIGLVPYKGLILAEISEFWLALASQHLPTHLIDRPHERVLRCLSCQPFKVEVVVRGYMAGSMARAYQKGTRNFCGVTLPEGLEAYRPLPAPIITPTTKAAAYEHDEDVSPEQLIERGVCTAAEWQEISRKALQLFALGQKVYAEKGWILVDTKYEFGRDSQGEIRVIDEIHTPDSSRLWVRDTYESQLQKGVSPEMLDKEVVRRYLMDQGFSGHGAVPHVPVEKLLHLVENYLKVAETLTGKTLMSEGPLAAAPAVN